MPRLAISEAPERLGLGVSRGWVIGHLGTIAVSAAVILWAARGQWFYYDEWDFLVSRHAWELLSPHNGHLSLVPRLVTTLVKGVAGLHEYWPYLLVTIAVHLVLVHLLWRLMLRTGSHPLIATLTAFAYAVLAPGAENVLWAFQVGFIVPIATGVAGFLLAMRPTLGARHLIGVIALLVIGLASSGTALPVTAALLLFLLVRHGWRPALIAAVSVAILYGVWWVTFNRVPQGTDVFRASTPNELLVGIPEYAAHGIVDGLAKTVPFGMLAPALLVGLAVWIVLDLTRSGIRRISVPQYLVLAALVFALLTAYSRVKLGVESASAGRYVYVYAALLIPAAARCLTVLARGSRVALGVVAVVLSVVIGYNIGGFLQQARAQSQLELSVLGAMSAAAELDDGSEEMASKRPSPVVAPPLTVSDLRDFLARGQFAPGAPTAVDELDARLNLLLESAPEPASSAIECAPVLERGFVPVDPATELLQAPAAAMLPVRGVVDGIMSRHAVIHVQAGLNRLTVPDGVDLEIEIPSGGALCVLNPER